MKRIFIPLTIGLLIGACSFLGGSIPFLDGPNPERQQQTEAAMTQQAQTQEALIKTQVAEGLSKLVAGPTPSAQAPAAEAAPVGAEETRTAEKTAIVSGMLTAAALTPSPDISQAGSSGFAGTARPSVDPKASDGTDFTGAYFYAWGQWDPTTYGVTVELKGPVGSEVGKNLIMKVNSQAMDKCTVPLEYPNRLYCTGKPFNGGKHAIEIYENVNGQEVLRFVDNYTFPTWTSTPTKAPKKDRATKTPEP